MSDPEVRRLESTDAFVVWDLPGADAADGVVRCARKVLVDSTKALARSRSYSWALLGQRVGGASAAINAEGDARGAAIAAFCEELAPAVAEGALVLEPGKGVGAADISALGELPDPDPAALAAGVVACAEAATDGLEGTRVAVEFDGGAGESLAAALAERGAEVVASDAGALSSDAEVLLFGSKPSLVDHSMAESLPHRVLVPTGTLPFTPRALAVAQRRGIVVLPDFLTTAGPLAARVGKDPGEELAGITRRSLDDPEGAVLGACRVAEEFLGTWRDELPFGRPIG